LCRDLGSGYLDRTGMIDCHHLLRINSADLPF
jgi:hypothetical protein